VDVYYCDQHEVPLPAGHPFPIGKYRRTRERVAAAGLPVRLLPAPAATPAELLLAHDPDWVQRVSYGLLTAAEQRRVGFPWSRELLRRSLHSVGGTIAAGRAALRDGLAASLAGGTHHARRDSGAGFCVFNDVVVALRVLQRDGATRRSVVLDCDVHQGDGTAALTADDPSVFTYSIHGRRNFPARKVAGDLDVPLDDGTGDDGYLAALEPSVERALEHARADVAFYLAGADPFAGDRWGRMALTAEGLARRDRTVLEACRRRGLPVAIVLAGGYAPDLDDIARIHARTIAIAAEMA